MTLNEVLDRFYCPAEKKAEITQAVMVGVGTGYSDLIVVYSFGSYGNMLMATVFPKLWDGSGSISPPHIRYYD